DALGIKPTENPQPNPGDSTPVSDPNTSGGGTSTNTMDILKNLEDKEQGPAWTSYAAWTSLGLAVSLAITGTVFGVTSNGKEGDLDSLLDFQDANGLPSRFEGQTRTEYTTAAKDGKDFEKYSI